MTQPTDPKPEPAPLRGSDASAAPEVEGAAPGKPLTAAARRALQEAAVRRALAHGAVSGHPDGDGAERGGPSGPEPTRFGDWERKGIAVDF